MRPILIILLRGWFFFPAKPETGLSHTQNRNSTYVTTSDHDFKYCSTPKRKLSKKLRSESAENQTRASFLGGKHYFAQYYRHCNFCERIDLVFLLEKSNSSALTASGQGKVKSYFSFLTLTKVAVAPTTKIFSALNGTWTFF